MFRDDLEAIERQKRHNAQMRKAGDQFSQLIDGAGDAQKEAVVDALFSAYRTKYNLSEQDEESSPDDAA